MKFKVTQVGCDTDYGEEVVVLEDEQVGKLTVREWEADSLEGVLSLLDGEVESVKFEESRWSRFDAELYLLCGDY